MSHIKSVEDFRDFGFDFGASISFLNASSSGLPLSSVPCSRTVSTNRLNRSGSKPLIPPGYICDPITAPNAVMPAKAGTHPRFRAGAAR
jgi:hypothetical protein